MLLTLTPFAQIKKYRQRASVEIQSNAATKFTDVLKDKVRSKGMMTEIMDINKEIKHKIVT